MIMFVFVLSVTKNKFKLAISYPELPENWIRQGDLYILIISIIIIVTVSVVLFHFIIKN